MITPFARHCSGHYGSGEMDMLDSVIAIRAAAALPAEEVAGFDGGRIQIFFQTQADAISVGGQREQVETRLHRKRV